MGSGAHDWKLDGKAAAALAKVERQFQHIGALKEIISVLINMLNQRI